MCPNTWPSGMKMAPGESPGAISAGSGDRIRTCDLWVMSQPVAVSPGAVGLIAARQRRRAVQLVACVAVVLMDFAVFCAQIRDQQAGWFMPVVSRPPSLS